MNFDAILFDFDGTLANTNELIKASYKHTFKTHYDRSITDSEIMQFWGFTLNDVFSQVDHENRETLIKIYREFNLKYHDDYVSIFPNVQESLQTLNTMKIPLGIVTNKIRTTTVMGLEFLQIQHYFSTIVSSSDVDFVKPHPAPIYKAIEDLSLSSNKILMVGDSPHDIECAKAAGVSSAAVGWSLYEKSVLQAHNPDYYIESIEELVDLVS